MTDKDGNKLARYPKPRPKEQTTSIIKPTAKNVRCPTCGEPARNIELKACRRCERLFNEQDWDPAVVAEKIAGGPPNVVTSTSRATSTS
jgi:hypothetical protein